MQEFFVAHDVVGVDAFWPLVCADLRRHMFQEKLLHHVRYTVRGYGSDIGIEELATHDVRTDDLERREIVDEIVLILQVSGNEAKHGLGITA